MFLAIREDHVSCHRITSLLGSSFAGLGLTELMDNVSYNKTKNALDLELQVPSQSSGSCLCHRITQLLGSSSADPDNVSYLPLGSRTAGSQPIERILSLSQDISSDLAQQVLELRGQSLL